MKHKKCLVYAILNESMFCKIKLWSAIAKSFNVRIFYGIFNCPVSLFYCEIVSLFKFIYHFLSVYLHTYLYIYLPKVVIYNCYLFTSLFLDLFLNIF